MRNPRAPWFAFAAFTLVVALALVWHHGRRDAALSPYVPELSSPVRGLSGQEVDDLLNGRGAGYARTAELNGYPGPRHVLDFERELGLSSEVSRQVQSIFAHMQSDAKRLGREIVHRERQFSEAFATRAVSADAVQRHAADLSALYGQLRATHLRAHVDVTPLLSAAQIAKYNTLRGYSGGPERPLPDHRRRTH